MGHYAPPPMMKRVNWYKVPGVDLSSQKLREVNLISHKFRKFSLQIIFWLNCKLKWDESREYWETKLLLESQINTKFEYNVNMNWAQARNGSLLVSLIYKGWRKCHDLLSNSRQMSFRFNQYWEHDHDHQCYQGKRHDHDHYLNNNNGNFLRVKHDHPYHQGWHCPLSLWYLP